LPAPFDIFKHQPDGNAYWVEAAKDFEAAKARAQVLTENCRGSTSLLTIRQAISFSLDRGARSQTSVRGWHAAAGTGHIYWRILCANRNLKMVLIAAMPAKNTNSVA